MNSGVSGPLATGDASVADSVQTLGEDPRELAHDVLQPAATIAALAAVALGCDAVPDSVVSCLLGIQSQAHFLAQLCVGVAAGAAARPLPIAVEQVVAEAVETARPAWPGQIVIMAEPAAVVADPCTLRRAVGNLLSNACRAAGDGGRVEVHVAPCRDEGGQSCADGCVAVAVHDSGPGFGRGPAGVAMLGLRAVHRTARGYGGSVTAADSPVGGACVTLHLPGAHRSR